jgi:transposase
MPRKCPFRIDLSDAERARLEATARKYTSPYRDVIRAKIVLYAAAGLENDEIAARLDTPRQIVSKWRKRFFRERLRGWRNAPALGARRSFPRNVLVAIEVRAGNRLSKSSLVLKHSRWCLLKRVENLTARQTVKLKELLACNLPTVRAYLLKEQLQFFWEYASAAWAGKFLEQWCAAAMRTRLEPMNSNLQSNKRHVVS